MVKMGHSQKKDENLLASSVAEVQMSRRSGRRLQASGKVSDDQHWRLTLHQTKQHICGNGSFVGLVQHDDRVFRTVGINQKLSEQDTVRLKRQGIQLMRYSP